jgi:citrate synthase
MSSSTTLLLLHESGIAPELFTPTLCRGTSPAHCLERLRDGRLIRPQLLYIGPLALHFDHDAHAASV